MAERSQNAGFFPGPPIRRLISIKPAVAKLISLIGSLTSNLNLTDLISSTACHLCSTILTNRFNSICTKKKTKKKERWMLPHKASLGLKHSFHQNFPNSFYTSWLPPGLFLPFSLPTSFPFVTCLLDYKIKSRVSAISERLLRRRLSLSALPKSSGMDGELFYKVKNQEFFFLTISDAVYKHRCQSTLAPHLKRI